MSCGTCAIRTEEEGKQVLSAPASGIVASGSQATMAGVSWVQELLPGFLSAESGSQATIAGVNWRKRRRIGMGGYSVVYEVQPGVVAKVGEVDSDEVEVQRWAAEQGWALPVYDYGYVDLPDWLTAEVCAVHGPRKEIVAPDSYLCTCNEPAGVLLMPMAEDLSEEEARSERVRSFQAEVAQAVREQFDWFLDCRPANVMSWKGRLVIIDFGEEQ